MRQTKKRGWGGVLGVLAAALLALVLPFLLVTQARAEGSSVSFPFLTSVKLTSPDGTPLGEDVAKDAPVKITYDFEIPNDNEVKEGDTYSFTVPEQIAFSGPITQDLMLGGQRVATVNITADGVGTVTFTEFASAHTGVGGTFSITTRFNAEKIENTKVVKIPFEVGGKIEYVEVHFAQPEATNSKTGAYDAATGTITWTLTLNSNKTTIAAGSTLSDVIAPGGAAGQTYVDGTFKVTSGSGTVYDSSTSTGSGKFSYDPVADDDSTTGSLAYEFANAFEDAVTVTYQTKLTDPSQYFGKQVTNSATFTHDGIDQDINGTADVSTPTYLTKTGTYNEETGQIDWTITFNPDALKLHNVKITDTLPEGLILDKDSVKLDGGAPGSFTYENGTLVYSAGDIDASHTLTFSTDLPEDYWQQNHDSGEYKNTATLTADDNVYLEGGTSGTSEGVGPGNSVIRKTALGYDAETHRITWQIVVNGNKNALSDATITDTLSKGQKYLPDTFTIDDGAPTNTLTGAQSFSSTDPADPATNDTVLTYHFGAISDTYTITYQTELTDPSVWAGNASVSYTNSVTLSPGGGVKDSTTTSTQKVNSTVISKDGVSYDYATHELKWSVKVNESQIPLTGVVVTDPLTGNGLDDFDLDESSIQVDGASLAAPYSYTYDGDSKLLTVNLGDLNGADLASRTKTITFTMKLNKTGADYDEYFGQNGTKTITNEATLKSDQNPSTKDKGTQDIANALVDKAGYYTSGKAYIDWAVEVNQNGIALDGIVLTDQLQEGLALDTSSVRLYAQTLNADGSLTPAPTYADGELTVSGTPIDLTAANVAYDAETRTFTFTMPDGVGDGQPCLLVFRTTVDPAYASGTTFSNSISLTSSTYHEETTSSEQEVAYSTSDGSAWGSTGDVTLTKQQSETETPLSGATFALYDSYGNLIRTSDATDGDGQTVLSLLNYNTLYTVREQTAPTDHESTDASYSFKLLKSGSIQLCDEQGNPVGDPVASLPVFLDDLKTGSVTFTKLGDGGQPLAGAEFTLCDTDGNPVEGFEPQTSGADGRVTFADVPYGDYQIVETKAPAGYAPLTISVSLHDSNDAIVSEGTTHALDLGDQTDGAQGSLTLTKYSAEYEGGSTAVMSDIEFQVLDSAGNVVGERTTNADGTATFSDLPLGSYTLHEVSTPADYQTLADVPFTISAEQSAAERQVLLAVTNVKESGTIRLTKVSSKDDAPLEGVTFTLYDATGTNVISNASGPLTATSGASGVVELSGVPYGDYVLRETTPAPDHEAYDDIEVSLRDGNSDVVEGALDLGEVVDQLKAATVSFVKTDGATPLQGAEFSLTRADGGFTATATSGADGVVTFEGVPYSDSVYTLHETKTPNDDVYFKVDDVTFALNDKNADVVTDGQTHVLTLADQVDAPFGSVTLLKTDETGTAPLSGATFQLLGASGQVVATATTGENGIISFSELPLSATGETTYTLHETSAPGDYALADDVIVTLSNSDAAGARDASVTIADVLKVGSITLTKVDAVTGAPLAGATFTLYDLDGNPVLGANGLPISATTGTDGTLTISGVTYGDYELRETTVPEGYQAADPLAISLHDDNDRVSGGVLSLGKVADAPVSTTTTTTTTTTSKPKLPGTGDASFTGMGGLLLAAVASLGAAGAMRRSHGRR